MDPADYVKHASGGLVLDRHLRRLPVVRAEDHGPEAPELHLLLRPELRGARVHGVHGEGALRRPGLPALLLLDGRLDLLDLRVQATSLPAIRGAGCFPFLSEPRRP